MEKEFVTYEIALKLKELSFDEVCLAVYFNNKFQLVKGFNINNVDLHVANEIDAVLAPLWQQAIDWLREKYNIHISLGYSVHHKLYNYRIDSSVIMMKRIIYWDSNYEKLREQAILKALELINKTI